MCEDLKILLYSTILLLQIMSSTIIETTVKHACSAADVEALLLVYEQRNTHTCIVVLSIVECVSSFSSFLEQEKVSLSFGQFQDLFFIFYLYLYLE